MMPNSPFRSLPNPSSLQRCLILYTVVTPRSIGHGTEQTSFARVHISMAVTASARLSYIGRKCSGQSILQDGCERMIPESYANAAEQLLSHSIFASTAGFLDGKQPRYAVCRRSRAWHSIAFIVIRNPNALYSKKGLRRPIPNGTRSLSESPVLHFDHVTTPAQDLEAHTASQL
jgi:hypothetical protein